MTEQLTERPKFDPSGWHYTNVIIDHLEAEGLFPMIQEEEVAALLAGEPVHAPALMRSFDSLEEFRREQNNFRAAFTTKTGSTPWIQYRRRPAFQRFELLYPDMVAALTEDRGAFIERSDEYWEHLYRAYQLMSKLVSLDDPYVIDESGTLDEDYLCR